MLRLVSWVCPVFLSVAMLLPVGAQAQPKNTAAADLETAQADPDFGVQGEYVGTVPTDNGPVKYGVQIVALGDHKFRAIGFQGGLPGDGWDNKTKREVEGQTKDGVTAFVLEDVTCAVKDSAITIKELDGKLVTTFKKVQRTSPTIGAKPPVSAVVLFDGKSPDAFAGGRMTTDGLLMEGATSKQKFQSYTIHVEFRLPFEPTKRGQGRGNSGCYAQGRYEVQVLDSFGLPPANNECGGIYSVAAPAIPMSFSPLSWQTYDIDFTAAQYENGKKVKPARMTVRQNGVEIHKDVEVPHATTAAPVPEGPEPGPVYLQNHGNPVRFRNIWVVAK